jgi:putative DNA primase/helicase
MDFVNFAQAHGILIDSVPPPGRWIRLPTKDHPKKRNGAVKYMGDHGLVQNWAEMDEVAVWHTDTEIKSADRAGIARRAKEAEEQIERGQKRAAKRAEWILSQCELATHPYLARKGFPDEMANVWQTESGLLLVIPMRVGRELVGCQLISEDGSKRFLSGQRTSDAAFVIDKRGAPVLCEGYATGLSVRAALNAIRARYALFVCFSAHNLARIAKTLPTGLVVADNDVSGTGERVAKETGWPYFMPPTVGQDFNDWHQATSLFKCSQALRSALLAS